jgi:hypothetical protein
MVGVAIPIVVVGYLLLMMAIGHAMTISTDKAVYQSGETITFTVRNNGLNTIEFANPGLGFRIINLGTGQDVSLGWAYPQVVHYMYPLGWENIKWDQKEMIRGKTTLFDSQLVKPGNYAARVVGGIDSDSVSAEVKFRISD